ncbi:MAG: glycosyl transferase [Clostridiales bacterium]|nr:glycosyl transferase [Clostridiales bacterium]
MIPKIIHYCWFGGNKKPKLIKKCIKTWHKFCPDYEIIEWNENNFDVNICEYTRQAYEARKWAFVSDYCRFYALEKMGGIYVDTDVELLKNLDMLLNENFMGFENAHSVATGLIMGCDAGNRMCKTLLDDYNNDRFIIDDKMNLRTVCTRVTDLLVENGLQLEDRTQCVLGYTVYDSSYFNPFDMDTGVIRIKDNTVSIHHYAASWCGKKEKFRGKVYRVLRRIFGKKAAEKLRKIFGRKK